MTTSGDRWWAELRPQLTHGKAPSSVPQPAMTIRVNKTLSLLLADPWPGPWSAVPARGLPCLAWPGPLPQAVERLLFLFGRMDFHCCGGNSQAVVGMRKSPPFSEGRKQGAETCGEVGARAVIGSPGWVSLAPTEDVSAGQWRCVAPGPTGRLLLLPGPAAPTCCLSLPWECCAPGSAALPGQVRASCCVW